MISLREIMKMMRLSKEFFAAEGGKILFTQPQHARISNIISRVNAHLAKTK